MITVVRSGVPIKIPREVRAGGSEAMEAYISAELEKQPRAKTREELDTMARNLGIEEPEKLPNKSAVEEAIEAAKAN